MAGCAERLRCVLLSALATLALAAPARADEGMWTFDNFPLKQLQQRYAFTPTPEWLDHVRKACVSFGGASGAFVSPEGLVITNHHVALGQLQKVSTPKQDYVRDGFFARAPAEEMPCPDLELKVLLSMQDVTGEVLAAMDPRASQKEQNAQRRAVTARIEKASTDSTGLFSEVVELYHGGEYWLYRFKKYTDVRLVMAPEEQAAFFGGDPDNFCYPRHDLDYAFFRVYEKGRPVSPPSWLRFDPKGPADGDLVMVCGHPGSTSRARTAEELEYERDYDLPLKIQIRENQLKTLEDYSARGAEEARQATDRIFGLQNTLKRFYGFADVLQRPTTIAARHSADDALKARVGADSALAGRCGPAWDRIAAVEREMAAHHQTYLYRTLAVNGRLPGLAMNLVRYVVEIHKPNGQRLTEYRDSRLESLRYQLFSPAPLYPAMEEEMLRASLEECLRALGPEDAFVKAALGGRPPAEVAHDLIAGTRLADPAYRRQLADAGEKGARESRDPLVQWAWRVDGPYREIRKWYEDGVEGVESLEGGKIARARFKLDGSATYPDATGTLRFAFGKVAGYQQLTSQVPWKTTFLGLYDRAQSFEGRPPFDLPARVAAHRPDVALDTPLNFVSTDDIVGGNSGSPVIDRNGNYVGLIFDGNTQCFEWDYFYSDAQARAVSVHPAAIVESLRHIYGMPGLVDELLGGSTVQ